MKFESELMFREGLKEMDIKKLTQSAAMDHLSLVSIVHQSMLHKSSYINTYKVK